MIWLVCQNRISPSSLEEIIRTRPVKSWVYLGEDSTWRILAEASVPDTVTRISIADNLERQSRELRSGYLNGIGELSLKNSSLEWWASELAAKNPYNKLYIRICILATARELLASGRLENTLIICSSPVLCDEVTRFASNSKIPFQPVRCSGKVLSREVLRTMAIKMAEPVLRFFPPVPSAGKYFSLYQKFLEKDVRYRRDMIRQNLKNSATDFSGKDKILLFTWVDRRNFTPEGEYTDPYFGPLPQLLKERGYRVAFVPRILFTIPFREALTRLNGTQETMYFPEAFLNQKDFNTAIDRMSDYRPEIPEGATIGGVPAGLLARENFEETRQLLTDNLLYEPLISRMKEEGIHPDRIIHTCEGHSWEQALSWSVHRHMPGTKVIGYDNVTFSRLVLSMYPAANEYGKRPLPDRIVTNGPLYRDVLIKEGLPASMVSAGCALRHTYLWKETGVGKTIARPRIPEKPWKILVATAIGLGDSVELVAKACDAFGGDENYEILVKCHPLVNPKDVRRYLGARAESENIKFDERPVSVLLPDTQILLYTYTSVCFEAMIHGVIPVCIRAENFLNLDKLDAVPDIRWCATTPSDLQKIALEIRSMPDQVRSAWQERAYQIVKDALAPPSGGCIDAFLA